MAPRIDAAAIANDPAVRAPLLPILESALRAVDPGEAVRAALRFTGEGLQVGKAWLPLPRRVIVLALGKAAGAMAAAALEALHGLEVEGVVVCSQPPAVPGLEAINAGHPVPDAGSLRGGARMLALAAAAGAGDLVLALMSGGGSAMAEEPAPGLNLEDLQAVNRLLLRSGAPIAEVNAVRRHLSVFKGGRLAAAAQPALVATLIVSDVVGDPLEVIAGGPTVTDPTTPADALAVVERHQLRLPRRVLTALERSQAPILSHPLGPTVVVANGARAAAAAVAQARELGFAARLVSTSLEGEAAGVGRDLAAQAAALEPGEMEVSAGETTVTVAGKGTGGRNQELALAAGIALAGTAPGAAVASFATDGIDGPTRFAGGIGDPGTVARGGDRGLDAASCLAANDSATYLSAVGDTIECGPTGTNVGDLMITWRIEG